MAPLWRRYSTLETLPSLPGDVRELAPAPRIMIFLGRIILFSQKIIFSIKNQFVNQKFAFQLQARFLRSATHVSDAISGTPRIKLFFEFF